MLFDQGRVLVQNYHKHAEKGKFRRFLHWSCYKLTGWRLQGNRVIFLVKEGSSIFMPPGIGTHSADQKLRRLWPRTSKVVDRSARAPLLGIKVPSDLSFNASLQHFFSTLHCCLAALV
ncbi:hypothetical protein ACFX15_018980 [Malus domestica]